MQIVQSDDVYNLLYDGLCNAIRNDPAIDALKDEFYFNLEPVSEAPKPTPSRPKKIPTLTVLPTSNNYSGFGSSTGALKCTYDIQVEGFYIRNLVRNKLAWILIRRLHYFPFSQVEVDGNCYNILWEVENATWDYDGEAQTMTHHITFTMTVYL